MQILHGGTVFLSSTSFAAVLIHLCRSGGEPVVSCCGTFRTFVRKTDFGNDTSTSSLNRGGQAALWRSSRHLNGWGSVQWAVLHRNDPARPCPLLSVARHVAQPSGLGRHGRTGAADL